MALRDRLPDPKDDISVETFDVVKKDLEIYFFDSFKDNVAENSLEDISNQELRESVKIAVGKHERNEEFVREKTQKLAGALGLVSMPVGGNGSPIQLSGGHLIASAILGYGRLFTHEVELRKYFIENLTFHELTGNPWVYNRRRSWNLLFYKTRFLGRILILCYIREMSEHMYKLSIENKLSEMEGTPLKERMGELGAKWNGTEGLDRMDAKREKFPVEG